MVKYSKQEPSNLLIIAGSDSGGGAGITADVKVATQFGIYSTICLTAATAQNTAGVSDVLPIPPAFVASQIASVLADIPIGVVKIGMLHNKNVIESVFAKLLAYKKQNPRLKILLDPVMIATSGDKLLEPTAEQSLKEHFQYVDVITPNLDEAQAILGQQGKITKEVMKQKCQEIARKFSCDAVLLKAGHLQNEDVLTDVLYENRDVTRGGIGCKHREGGGAGSEDGGRAGGEDGGDYGNSSDGAVAGIITEFHNNRFASDREFHGTGCSLATAIACGLAQGLCLQESTQIAINYIQGEIKTSKPRGKSAIPIGNIAPNPHL